MLGISFSWCLDAHDCSESGQFSALKIQLTIFTCVGNAFNTSILRDKMKARKKRGQLLSRDWPSCSHTSLRGQRIKGKKRMPEIKIRTYGVRSNRLFFGVSFAAVAFKTLFYLNSRGTRVQTAIRIHMSWTSAIHSHITTELSQSTDNTTLGTWWLVDIQQHCNTMPCHCSQTVFLILVHGNFRHLIPMIKRSAQTSCGPWTRCAMAWLSVSDPSGSMRRHVKERVLCVNEHSQLDRTTTVGSLLGLVHVHQKESWRCRHKCLGCSECIFVQNRVHSLTRIALKLFKVESEAMLRLFLVLQSH